MELSFEEQVKRAALNEIASENFRKAVDQEKEKLKKEETFISQSIPIQN